MKKFTIALFVLISLCGISQAKTLSGVVTNDIDHNQAMLKIYKDERSELQNRIDYLNNKIADTESDIDDTNALASDAQSADVKSGRINP